MIACDQIVSSSWSFQGKVHPMVVKNSDYDCHHVATYYVFTPRVVDVKLMKVVEIFRIFWLSNCAKNNHWYHIIQVSTVLDTNVRCQCLLAVLDDLLDVISKDILFQDCRLGKLRHAPNFDVILTLPSLLCYLPFAGRIICNWTYLQKGDDIIVMVMLKFR